MTYAINPTHAALKLPTFKLAAIVFASTIGLIQSFRRLMKQQEPDAISVREAQIRREAANRRVNNLLR